MLDTLVDAGVDVISFGNNHSMDWGYEAMFDCLERCRKRGITTVGFGRNLAGAREPAIVERDGTRFGFLAYCCVGPPGSTPPTTVPATFRSGSIPTTSSGIRSRGLLR